MILCYLILKVLVRPIFRLFLNKNPILLQIHPLLYVLLCDTIPLYTVSQCCGVRVTVKSA